MKELIKSLVPKTILARYRKSKTKRHKKKLGKRFAGEQVSCPICNSSYSIFGSFGVQRRENAQCYHCDSLERHRLLFLYLNQRFELFSNSPKTNKTTTLCSRKSVLRYILSAGHGRLHPMRLIS